MSIKVQERFQWQLNFWNNYLLSSAGNLMKPEVYDKTQKSFELAVKYLKNDTTQSETLSNSYRNLANLNRLRQNFELADSYIEKAQKSRRFKYAVRFLYF